AARIGGTSAHAASIRAVDAPLDQEDRRFTPSARRIIRSRMRRERGGRARLLRLRDSMNRMTSRAVRLTAALLLFSGAAAGAQAPRAVATLHAPRWIIVSNERSHDLTLLDGTTLEPVGSIPVPGRARGGRISTDHKFVLVALSGERPQTPARDDATAEGALATRRAMRRMPAGTGRAQSSITPQR